VKTESDMHHLKKYPVFDCLLKGYDTKHLQIQFAIVWLRLFR